LGLRISSLVLRRDRTRWHQCGRVLLLLGLGLVFALLPVEPHVPVVLGGQRAHGLEEVVLGVVALLGGRRHAAHGRVGVRRLRQPREAAREERGAHGHGGGRWGRRRGGRSLCLVWGPCCGARRDGGRKGGRWGQDRVEYLPRGRYTRGAARSSERRPKRFVTRGSRSAT
jgi:hypothetical protein